jgi:hypothetical protein
MGKVINEGFYTSDDEIPQPCSIITGANLRANEPPAPAEGQIGQRREEVMGKVIDGGFSTSDDEIPQCVGIVYGYNLRQNDPPVQVGPPAPPGDRKAAWLASLRQRYGEQWVADNATALDAEWEYFANFRPGVSVAPVPRLVPPGQDPPGHA